MKKEEEKLIQDIIESAKDKGNDGISQVLKADLPNKMGDYGKEIQSIILTILKDHSMLKKGVISSEEYTQLVVLSKDAIDSFFHAATSESIEVVQEFIKKFMIEVAIPAASKILKMFFVSLI